MKHVYNKRGDFIVIRGVGDVVASVATPLARAMKLRCIDPKTKNLKPDSRCAKWKKKLNEIGIAKPPGNG